MDTPVNINSNKIRLQIVLGAVLLVSFFLPWVSWKDKLVSGYHMPSGKFFSISDKEFGLANPFPQFDFAFNIFWLIPALTLLLIIFLFLKRKTFSYSFTAGALSLSLVMVFFLFTGTLIDLGVGNNIFGMLKPGIYIHTFSAMGLILTAFPVKNILTKFIWLLVGPLLAYGGYMIGEKYAMSANHIDTETSKPAYTVKAIDFIQEFAKNDSAANNKYNDKIIEVNGIVSGIERSADSTTTIQFADTTGSYIIFSFEKEQLDEVKNIKPGDVLSLKGSCSGSIFSEILGTTSISFKRSTLNKIKQ